MSKLVTKLISEKILKPALGSRMETSSIESQAPSTDREMPHSNPRSDGVENMDPEVAGGKEAESKNEVSTDMPNPGEGKEIVVSHVQQSKEAPSRTPAVEEEEIPEIKTPGYLRVFGCDDCEEEDTDKHEFRGTSSDESEDESGPQTSATHPTHLIPVVHLRVPMKNEDDVRKVIASLQCRGVLDVACDLENNIVKVTGTADPDRLLKKVKKVKRKSKLISYSNPLEMPSHQENRKFGVPPPRTFHQPAFDGLRPPFHSSNFPREPYGPYLPPHSRPDLRPPTRPFYYSGDSFYHNRSTPNMRPPPGPQYYRDDSFYYDHIPTNRRPPTSPPHHGGTEFYHDRIPPNMRPPPGPPHYRDDFSHPFPNPRGGQRFSYFRDDCRRPRMMHMYH